LSNSAQKSGLFKRTSHEAFTDLVSKHRLLFE
jgi:hypothetical protein